MELFEYEKEHLKLLHDGLAECTVLLKSNGAFPLEKAGTIAAYGSGVRDTLKGGTGSGEVNSRYYVTIEQGLEAAGFTVTSQKWLEGYQTEKEKARVTFKKTMKAEAKANQTPLMVYAMGAVMPEPEYELPLAFDSDSAIYVLSRICGEGSDRKICKGDLLLTDTEIRDILLLQEHYDKFMLVLNVGGPVDLTPVQAVDNILLLSQLGVETGAALAEILLGKLNPSGRLTTSWSAMGDYNEDIHFGHADDTCYKEGIYVGYRYFDTVQKKAMYPFGFGLSYTSFTQQVKQVTSREEKIHIEVEVTNTGKCAGKEVVQVYVSLPDGRLDKPYQDLAAFGKTKLLNQGESETLIIEFKLSDLASFDEENMAYILEKGEYLIRVGCSSVDTRIVAAVELPETVLIKKVRSIVEKSALQEKSYPRRELEAIPENAVRIRMEVSFFERMVVSYDLEEEIIPEAKQLSDEELVAISIGAYSTKGGLTSIIGNAAQTVAGAAGETSTRLKDKFGTLVMADGPAGLRLSQRFYRDEKGVHAIGGTALPESIAEWLPTPVKVMTSLLSLGRKKAPSNSKVEYQYATAIPIGTGIAQSWNLDFAECCGDIVGDEMQRFGVHLWLAPAQNIHRSIQCGRNFEYFSEDPLISGKFSAAITRGVQKHSGCGTTIKHYVANNQERNRLNNNSQLSERALREIYLKGFAICVKEAQPHAIMSSYNLVNGTHTSETRGLITDYLRAENGFRGIVMTDWVVSFVEASKAPKYRGALSNYVAAAGGDVFMPGCQQDYDHVMNALKDGSLSREQLEINASRMIKMLQKLNSR